MFDDDFKEFLIIIFIIIIIIGTIVITSNNHLEKIECRNIGNEKITDVKNIGFGLKECFILTDDNFFVPFESYSINNIDYKEGYK